MINYIASHINFPFAINFIFLFFFLFLNFSIPIFISSKFNLRLIIPLKIIIINFFFFIIYTIFVNYIGSDGLSFYLTEKTSRIIDNFNNCGGTKGCVRDAFLIQLSASFKDLKINYLNSILLLNIFSTLAFLFYYIKVEKLYIFNNFDTFLVFFVLINSGILFWGNGFIKDNFIILAISIFLLSIKKDNIDFKLAVIAILICLIIRPLPGLFMVISIFLYLCVHMYMFNEKNLFKYTKFFVPVLIGAIILTFKQYNIPINLNFISEISNKIYSIGSSSSDPSYITGELTFNPTELNFFERIFHYYFLPIKFSSNPLYLFISIQNISIILLTVFVFILFFKNLKLSKKFIIDLKFQNIFFIYVVLYNLIIPHTSYNYGIALRQKWMCLLILTYLFALYISFVLKHKDKQKNN